MSQANVEIVKRAIDAFNRRDPDSYGDPLDPETYSELFTPDFEWLPALPAAVEGSSYRGRKGIETVDDERRETWGPSACSRASFAISATACSCSVGRRHAGEVVASRSIHHGEVFTIFAATKSRGAAPISITARRCGRRAWRSDNVNQPGPRALDRRTI